MPCRAEIGMQRKDTALTQLQRFWMDYAKSVHETCFGALGVCKTIGMPCQHVGSSGVHLSSPAGLARRRCFR